MGRVMALDYGRARIGVALSDENKSISFPRPFIPAGNPRELYELIASENVELVLVGLPKNLRGEEEEMAKEARHFGEKLEKEAKVAVRYVDERFTTHQARDKLREAETRGRDARAAVDSMSAHVILEQYLGDLKK